MTRSCYAFLSLAILILGTQVHADDPGGFAVVWTSAR